MSVAGRIAAVAGGVLGVAAAGTAIALGVARRREIEDAYADEPFGRLRPDRTGTVVTSDGIELSTEEVEPVDGGKPDATVVFVHGFALSRRCWHFQRRGLAALTGPRVRQVLYDQRSHGRSGRAALASSTIEQLGRDLHDVIGALAPDGPLVLVGHSMGGMTIMALAEQDPWLFAERVCGVALIGTSAGDVGGAGLSRPLLSRYNPLPRGIGRLADWQPGLVEWVRAAGGQLTRRAVRSLAFGSRDVSPSLVDFMMSELDVTPVRVLADFIDTLGAHNRYAALAALARTHVLVLSGDTDRMTPPRHAERIAAELPDAELVRARGAGHMVMLEQPQLVNDHLALLLQQCVHGRAVHRRRRWRR